MGEKFDTAKLARLADPSRFEQLVPETIWAALGVPAPETVIDLGAGTGLFAARFAAMAPAATVYAVDVSPASIEWMQRRLPEVAEGRVVPVLAAESHVPLPDEVADAVVAINLHHELDDPEGSYSDVLRLLRPGGRFLVVDWAKRETPKGPPLVIRATAEEIAATLASAGFAEVSEREGLVWHSMVRGTRF